MRPREAVANFFYDWRGSNWRPSPQQAKEDDVLPAQDQDGDSFKYGESLGLDPNLSYMHGLGIDNSFVGTPPKSNNDAVFELDEPFFTTSGLVPPYVISDEVYGDSAGLDQIIGKEVDPIPLVGANIDDNTAADELFKQIGGSYLCLQEQIDAPDLNNAPLTAAIEADDPYLVQLLNSRPLTTYSQEVENHWLYQRQLHRAGLNQLRNYPGNLN